MDSTRRSTRHLEPKDGSGRASGVDTFRASTADSGRGSMAVSERASTADSGRGSMAISERASTGNSITAGGASSSLSRDTSLGDDYDNGHEEFHDDQSIRIPRAPILGDRCHEQAFVSHIDHPSAFFLQVAHPHQKFEELHEEINKFYSKNSKNNPSKWKRGDYCIAKDDDDEFYRARIVEVPEVTKTADVYDVVFLDFGNWKKVPTTNIHLLLPKFATLPAQAIPCSLTKTLPKSGCWSDHPEAMKFFAELVFEKYVDATFRLKRDRDFWPFCFVELHLSGSKLDVRQCMKDAGHIREAKNDEIYIEFGQLLGPQDYIIYSIPHEDEDNDEDD